MSQRKAALRTQWSKEACPRLPRRNLGTGRTPGLDLGHSMESSIGEASKARQPLPQLVHKGDSLSGEAVLPEATDLRRMNHLHPENPSSLPPRARRNKNKPHPQTKSRSDIPEKQTW